MADSLEDLGTASMFPMELNWATIPSSTIEYVRRIAEYRGTVQNLEQVLADAPIPFEARFTPFDKEEEYELLDFFNDRRGMNQRFWIKHPRAHFTLKTTATTGSSALTCEPNRAHIQYQGYERIYIAMDDGDVLTRQVTSVVYNAGTDDQTVTINTVLDRDVTTINQNRIGRLLLVRFDSDTLTQRITNDRVCEIALKFYELVSEYSVV